MNDMSQAAAKMGSAKSPAKTSTAQVNGKLGGRPVGSYQLVHRAGYSAYDHYAKRLLSAVGPVEGRNRHDLERALAREWKRIQPQPGIGPRIDVVKQ